MRHCSSPCVLALYAAAFGCGKVPAATDASTDSGGPVALTVTLEGTGTGKVQVEPTSVGADCDSAMKSCEYVVAAGTQVTLTVSANAGSTFVDWTGACGGIVEECTLTVDDAREVTANIGTPGEHLWSEAFLGGGAEGAATAIDAAGNVVVAFRNIGMIDVRGQQHVGNSDLLVVKFRRDKSLAWAKQFAGGESYMEPGDLAIAPNGDVVLVAVGSAVSLDGESLPATFGGFFARLDGESGAKKLLKSLSSNFSPSSVLAHGDEMLVSGSFTGSVDFGLGAVLATGTDSLLIWYSSAGMALRMRPIAGSGDEYASPSLDANGNVFVGGSYTGTIDVLPGTTGGELTAAAGASDTYLAHFAWDGTLKFSQRYYGPGADYFSVSMGPSGSPVVSGTAAAGFNLNPGGTGGDVTGPYIATITPDGALRWKYTRGTGTHSVDGRDSVYFRTVCDAASDFGNGTIPGSGRVCAARLDKTGALVWAKRFAVSDSGVAGGVRPTQLVAAPNGMHAFAGVAYEDVSWGGPTIPGNSSGFLYVGGP